jgi:hypothetical protein
MAYLPFRVVALNDLNCTARFLLERYQFILIDYGDATKVYWTETLPHVFSHHEHVVQYIIRELYHELRSTFIQNDADSRAEELDHLRDVRHCVKPDHVKAMFSR